MSEIQGTAAAPAAAKMSEFARLGNTFFDPKRTFADLAVKPRFWVPMILIIVLAVAYLSAFSSHVGWERFMRQQDEKSEQMQNLPADQREKAIEMQVKFAAPMGMAGAIVGTPVFFLASAGVLMFIFTNLLGSTVTFKQSLSIVSYSSLPGIIGSLAGLLVMFLKDPTDFDLQNPVGLNVGFYLDPNSTKAWIVSLCNSIDLLSFWSILLLATGFSIVAKKPWKSALMGVLMPWAVYVLIKVGWAAIRG